MSEISNSDPVSAGFSDWEKKFNIKPADGRQIKGPIEEDELAKKVGAACMHVSMIDLWYVCVHVCIHACRMYAVSYTHLTLPTNREV